MEEAQEKFEHALKIDPANVQASVGLADILDTSGNIDAEVVTLQAVNQINPNDYSVHVALGNAFMAHKQTDKAAEEFKRAFESNERLPDALLGDAQRLSLEGNKLAALEKAKQAAEIVPDSKDASLTVDKYKAALGLN